MYPGNSGSSWEKNYNFSGHSSHASTLPLSKGALRESGSPQAAPGVYTRIWGSPGLGAGPWVYPFSFLGLRFPLGTGFSGASLIDRVGNLRTAKGGTHWRGCCDHEDGCLCYYSLIFTGVLLGPMPSGEESEARQVRDPWPPWASPQPIFLSLPGIQAVPSALRCHCCGSLESVTRTRGLGRLPGEGWLICELPAGSWPISHLMQQKENKQPHQGGMMPGLRGETAWPGWVRGECAQRSQAAPWLSPFHLGCRSLHRL